MAAIDRAAIEDVGIPSLVLMENAARGVYRAIRENFGKPERVLVVAGKGNNGGDGMALARLLHLKGIHTEVYLALGEELSPDAQVQLNILKKLGVKVLGEAPHLGSYELLVDALLGTGFRPPVRGKLGEVIEKINASGAKVLSIDIPSGLSADSGEVFEPSVIADITVTMQFPKLVHYLFPASKRCGRVLVEDISIPPFLASHVRREVIELSELKLHKRQEDTYKNREGHVLIVGGSVGKTGAVVMSAKAATATGSGLVSVGVPQGLNQIFEIHLVEEMSVPLEGRERLSYLCTEQILELKDGFNALALGMGMDRYEEGQDIVLELLERWDKPLLLDADAINNLADSGEVDLLKKRKHITVLTPHIGEFSRLTGLSSKEITENQTEVASEFSKEYGAFLVLKGARSVIASPGGDTYLSIRGTPAMAKGGVGDVLSGVLVALLGKSIEPLEALKLGVSLHALAGELAETGSHRESLRATDLIGSLPLAYKEIEEIAG